MKLLRFDFLVCAAAVAVLGAAAARLAAGNGAGGVPTYGDPFWSHWGDGQAELSSYALTIDRYGEARRGTAVAIFVTESFSNRERVKADSGGGAGGKPGDVFPVMKLNLIEDFQTGLYDYNTMSSVFVALEPVNGLPAGSPTKIAYGSQEWCGHVYQHLNFERGKVSHELHSYLGGEANRSETLRLPQPALPADAILPWARGFAGPVLQPGERVKGKVLRTLQEARLRHEPLEWADATLMRSDAPVTVTVPAGTFECDIFNVEVAGGTSWTVQVERSAPQRVVRWSNSRDETAELLATKRMKYWELNANGKEALLAEIGLPVP